MAASVIFMVANNFLLTKDSVVPTFKKQLLVSEVSFVNKKKEVWHLKLADIYL